MRIRGSANHFLNLSRAMSLLRNFSSILVVYIAQIKNIEHGI
ncbi:MAG: hypothetical protein OFPII_13060 [Osedax symbiont Rs1]|nr:MAG: hypothetical protein OFPII_13060 [Osedax symbiont Rs1]